MRMGDMDIRRMIAGTFANPVSIYTLKFLFAAAIAYALLIRYPQHKLIWAMNSIALVLSPIREESNVLIADRILANMLGAAVASILMLYDNPNIILGCIGIVITIILSKILNIYRTVRTAVVTLVIIMVPVYEGSRIMIAFERLFCVIIGCVIALIITLLADALIHRIFKQNAG